MSRLIKSCLTKVGGGNPPMATSFILLLLYLITPASFWYFYFFIVILFFCIASSKIIIASKKFFTTHKSFTITLIRVTSYLIVSIIRINFTLYEIRPNSQALCFLKRKELLWVSFKMLGHKGLNEIYKSYAKYLPKNTTNIAVFL